MFVHTLSSVVLRMFGTVYLWLLLKGSMSYLNDLHEDGGSGVGLGWWV